MEEEVILDKIIQEANDKAKEILQDAKNKAQEIAGAINPICEKYKLCKPFKGAILSGVFTESSINQLRNDDFHVLYIPFKKIAQAFNTNGLNCAKIDI